ncbi:MAG: hypothetical protein HHAS10_07310 [Candidatus Altimarinota bacterium]
MTYILVVVALIVILIIMMQSKGTGLSIIPGSGDFGKFERRGPEKTLHTITIIMVSVFVLLSIFMYFVR